MTAATSSLSVPAVRHPDPDRDPAGPTASGDAVGSRAELLRSEDGLVWATVDGEANDILLGRGDVHVVARDCEMRVSAFGLARLEIYGNGPLRFEWPQRYPARGATALAWNEKPRTVFARGTGSIVVVSG